MKYLVVFSACFVLANALNKDFVDKLIQRAQKSGAECKESSKAPDTDIQLMLEKKVPATHEGKCMVFCVHKEFGVQNAEGKFSKDAAIKELDGAKDSPDHHKKMVSVIDHCMSTVAEHEDPCETAATYMVCAVEKAKELGVDLFDFES